MLDSQWGRPQLLTSGNRAGQCRWSGQVFSEISGFPPLYHSGAPPYLSCFTLTGSQDLDVGCWHPTQSQNVRQETNQVTAKATGVAKHDNFEGNLKRNATVGRGLNTRGEAELRALLLETRACSLSFNRRRRCHVTRPRCPARVWERTQLVLYVKAVLDKTRQMNSEPITGLHGKQQRIPFHLVRGKTGNTQRQYPMNRKAEIQKYIGQWSLAYMSLKRRNVPVPTYRRCWHTCGSSSQTHTRQEEEQLHDAAVDGGQPLLRVCPAIDPSNPQAPVAAITCQSELTTLHESRYSSGIIITSESTRERSLGQLRHGLRSRIVTNTEERQPLVRTPAPHASSHMPERRWPIRRLFRTWLNSLARRQYSQHGIPAAHGSQSPIRHEDRPRAPRNQSCRQFRGTAIIHLAHLWLGFGSDLLRGGGRKYSFNDITACHLLLFLPPWTSPIFTISIPDKYSTPPARRCLSPWPGEYESATMAYRLFTSSDNSPWRTGFDSRLGRPGIFAGRNRAGICRWSAGFLGGLPFPCSSTPALLHTNLASPSAALKTSMLSAFSVYVITLSTRRFKPKPTTLGMFHFSKRGHVRRSMILGAVGESKFDDTSDIATGVGFAWWHETTTNPIQQEHHVVQ
ncbi:hypothetical protein PR048_022739 [Dryococelus australis]|uniref:Uncharacterized protein n=1 Tax=Dryococelus australis TaxID=614101 RepID=A0ABQ9GS46_9NEOP|nr:hypothetical protein PR048_022739 [Dryococelus australis]